VRGWDIVTSRFNNAISAVRNPAGNIVCAINADASTTNDDANCAPINPFGNGNVSQAARDYVNARDGQDFKNEQVDLLATLGGSLFTLPGGDLGFSLAYEHRNEKADFVPLAANQQGLFGAGDRTLPQSGSYNTDEFSAEVSLPIFGGDFTLPMVQSLEVTGAYRHVDNNIAGKEDLFSVGGRWQVIRDIALRSSYSRNFRAPTLTQLLAPNSTALGSIAQDPCDADRINNGPNPTQRRASCLALFTANPGYGVLADGSNAGTSAAARLAGFQDPSENFNRANITTGGNPDLQNELSRTFTYGIVVQPRFIPGLTFVADRIEVNLKNGLSAFTTQNFAETCYDNADPPASVCEAFARLAAPNGTDPGGTILTGRTTTFNAGIVRFRGEVYNLNYNLPLASLFGGNDLGRLELGVEATHTSLLTTSVTGATFNRSDNTITQPDWVVRFDARYQRGPARFTYQVIYLDKVKANGTATIENNPNPLIEANWLHNASVQYDVGHLTLRAGVTNIFNTPPSYPTVNYGDILGRQVYVGARVRF
jgi:outer membrane receptor protein involved in Fe transport